MKKTLFITAIFLLSLNSFSQKLSNLISEMDSSILASRQFNFTNYSLEIDEDEKNKLFIEDIVGNSEGSLFYHTGFDTFSDYSFSEFKKLRLDDFNEIIKNFYIIDFDNDGDYDLLYDRVNFHWDTQSISLYKNTHESF